MKGTPRPTNTYRAARRNAVFHPKTGKKGTWPRDNGMGKHQELATVSRKPKGNGKP